MDTGGHNGELADSANYIEARDFLRPSMDHYRRAVEVADSQDALDGELLVHVSRQFLYFRVDLIPDDLAGRRSLHELWKCLSSPKQCRILSPSFAVLTTSRADSWL